MCGQSQALLETYPEDISLVSIDPKNLEIHIENVFGFFSSCYHSYGYQNN